MTKFIKGHMGHYQPGTSSETYREGKWVRREPTTAVQPREPERETNNNLLALVHTLLIFCFCPYILACISYNLSLTINTTNHRSLLLPCRALWLHLNHWYCNTRARATAGGSLWVRKNILADNEYATHSSIIIHQCTANSQYLRTWV